MIDLVSVLKEANGEYEEGGGSEILHRPSGLYATKNSGSVRFKIL